MYAIVEINGKQYQVEPGRYTVVDSMNDMAPDSTIEFDKVLLLSENGNVQVGSPYLNNTKIKAKVLSHFRGQKILVYKMRPKKGYRLKNGHRQSYTRLQIESVVS